MAAQAGFCLTWSETPEDTFCRVEAHMFLVYLIAYPVCLTLCMFFCSPWCHGLATTYDGGIPWTFHLTFFFLVINITFSTAVILQSNRAI